MSKRKSDYVAPEERTRDAAGDDADGYGYGYRIRCLGLRFEGDILFVKMKHAENHKTGWLTFDFSQAYLPPNRLHKQVTLLKDRPDLARVIIAAVDCYLLRQQESKSTANTAMGLAADVTRLLEYSWLNDLYHLKHISRNHWDDLLEKYVRGGWVEVLEVERRSAAVDIKHVRFTRRKQKKGVVEYSCSSMLETIGANLAENQVKLEYRKGDANAILRRARGDEQSSESSIASVIGRLNMLADIPRDMATRSLAHVNPYLYAASVNAIPSERTENFDPQRLAALMGEGYRWVDKYSDLIIRLTEKVYERGQEPDDEMDETRMVALLEAPETKELETALGVRINSVRRIGNWTDGIGLIGLHRVLLAACFSLIAVFNGRRKDEVQGKSIGVYAGGFQCLDSDLGIFEAYFYCEKTTKDYLPFYTNQITFKALNAAKRLSDIAWKESALNGGVEQKDFARKLFCIPPRSNEATPTWFDYSTDVGIGLLTQRATGSDSLVVPNAHMFRRAYAVVFYYRYENSDLYALSQQLDHFDLAMTMHYLLEGPNRVLAHHAAKLWGSDAKRKTARDAQAAELSNEVEAYGKIKLQDDVLAILTGKPVLAGAFNKLIQRFARKMYGLIKYDDADLRAAAKSISGVLIGRGHSVKPMAHGNCNAGSPKPSARCYKEGRLARESASLIVCGSCPYHLMKQAHLQAVTDDFERERSRLATSDDSLLNLADKNALKDTENLIAFYRRMPDPSVNSSQTTS
jgi:hypothetical protein